LQFDIRARNKVTCSGKKGDVGTHFTLKRGNGDGVWKNFLSGISKNYLIIRICMYAKLVQDKASEHCTR
jgi:hypothetical protein